MTDPGRRWKALGRRVTCVWVLALLTEGLGARPVAAEPFAYVANYYTRSVAVIRISDNTVVATVPVGAAPNALAVSPDGAFVYVGNSASNDVSVIRTSDNTVVATLPAGRTPEGVAFTPDGAFAYVANDGSNNVSVIRTSDLTIVATVPVATGSFRVAITPDGAFAYVSCFDANAVSVIRTSDNTVVATIPVGAHPRQIAVAPDGALVYVPNDDSDTLSVIRTSDNTVVATIPVGQHPDGVAVAPDGAFVYVINQISNDISVIRTSDGAVVATVPEGGAHSQNTAPVEVAIAPSGAFAYVTNFATSDVSVIRTSDITTVANIPVGLHPIGIAITPEPDTTPPSLSLPGNLTAEAASAAGAVVDYSATATDDVDGPVPVSCSPASGSTFPLGSTTVQCSATDAHNNTAHGSFSVTVQDTTAPSLSLPGNRTAEATGTGGASVSYSASASDLVDGSVSVSCSPASGSIFPLGSTSVQCSATDSHNNTSHGSFVVTVKDTTSPSLSLPGPIAAVATSTAGAAVAFTASATDTVDGPVAISCIPPSGSTFPPGTTSVICSASDAAGNSTAGTFPVTVTYSSSGALQPINADGSSIFKLGSTVPVKFQLTGPSASITNATAFRLYVAKVSDAVVGTEMEIVSSSPSSTGNLFRYDSSGNLYLYNWGTKDYTTGTYQLRVDLGDGVLNRTVIVSLKP